MLEGSFQGLKDNTKTFQPTEWFVDLPLPWPLSLGTQAYIVTHVSF
jgi:hypothetical protein